MGVIGGGRSHCGEGVIAQKTHAYVFTFVLTRV